VLRAGGRVLKDSSGLARLLGDLCAAEIPASPEEELELDLLARRLRDAGRGLLPISPFQALSFWVMKRRAGEVGERFGREHLALLRASLKRRPRLHLVGHSFGGKLVTSIVLGGARPDSVTLLLAAFSAVTFAREIPRYDRRASITACWPSAAWTARSSCSARTTTARSARSTTRSRAAARSIAAGAVARQPVPALRRADLVC
jgi:hypothetical protein